MMQSIHRLKNFLMLSLLGITLTATAAEPLKQKNDKVMTDTSPQIILYASNNDKKIIQTLSPTTHLIKIYQKGEWIKVGNTADGTVGWIYQPQYRQALDVFNQPMIQEVFISQTLDKDHKPQVNIMAYQNGKPVSEKDAQILYEDMKKQQQLQQKYWQSVNQQMITWQNQWLNSLENDLFFNTTMPFPMPVIVVKKDSDNK